MPVAAPATTVLLGRLCPRNMLLLSSGAGGVEAVGERVKGLALAEKVGLAYMMATDAPAKEGVNAPAGTGAPPGEVEKVKPVAGEDAPCSRGVPAAGGAAAPAGCRARRRGPAGTPPAPALVSTTAET